MRPGDFPLLALILFTPWFVVVGTLFWMYPRQPRHAARRRFDAGVLLLALAAFVLATWWGFRHADPGHHLWPQVLATSLGYGAYLLVMGAGYGLRRRRMARWTGRHAQF